MPGNLVSDQFLTILNKSRQLVAPAILPLHYYTLLLFCRSYAWPEVFSNGSIDISIIIVIIYNNNTIIISIIIIMDYYSLLFIIS